MKFRFCGDLDAPDWILKEIALLARITNIRVRLVCVQVINSILGEEIDYEKIEKLVKDANYDASDIRAAVAALRFIITSGIKYDVDDATLSNELQQLGLPKEHCDGLVKPYRDSKDKLRANAKESVMKFPRLESVDWRVDYLLSTSHLQELNTPAVQLCMNINDGKTSKAHTFEVPADKFRVLFYELKAAQSLIEGMEM